MSSGRRLYVLVASAVLALVLVATWSVPAAHAEGSDTSGPWYRYQGEPSSYDAANNQQVNCGPTSVAMVVQYVSNTYVPIRQVRAFIGKNSQYTSFSDVTSALTRWNVGYSANIRGVDDIRSVIERGRIALVVLDMRRISPGADVNGRSTDPALRTGRFETYAREHWLIVKGISADGRYFIVYDGNVWGGPGSPTYWYSDGTPKGLDRYYSVDEVARAMAFFGTGSVTGMEILSNRRLDAPRPATMRSAAPTNPPVNAFVTVTPRDVALTRYVTLSLGATAPRDRVVGMMVSNNSLFTDAFEEPFAATKQWALSAGDGPKSVYVRFKNSSGAWSRPAKAEVRLEEQPPVGSVVAAPDPRLVAALPLVGSPIATVGPQPRAGARLSYRPLGPNLLHNSSFELWAGGVPEGWSSPLGARAYASFEPVANALSGATALQSAAAGREAELAQRVVVMPDTSYVLSGWVRGSVASVVVEQLESQGVSSRSLSVHKRGSSAGGEWRRVELRFRTASNATDVLVGLSGAGSEFDAFQLEPGTRPTTYQPDGLLVEAAAVNHIANPSVENGVGRWSGLNSWVSVVDSRDYARFGSKALLVRKQKAGAAATVYPAALRVGQTYTFSAYVRLDSGAAVSNDGMRGWLYEGVKNVSEVITSRVLDSNRPLMTWQPVGGGWYRGSFTFTATAPNGVYGLVSTSQLGVGDVYYMDGAQLESGVRASSFVSGDMGPGYAWSSAPHRSVSTRSAVSLIGAQTTGTAGSLIFRARPYRAAERGAVLLTLGDVRVLTTGPRLSVLAGGRSIASAYWNGASADQFAVTWTGRSVSVYRNGRRVGSANAPGPRAGSTLSIGRDDVGSSPNAVLGDVSLWNTSLTPAALTGLAGRVQLDPGRSFVTTARTTVAVGAWDPTDKGVRAEWSLDGVSWQPWDQARGTLPWDLGAEDGRKTVWVRYLDRAGNWMEYTDSVTLDRTRPQVLGSGVLPGGELELRVSEPISAAALAAVANITDARGVATGRWAAGARPNTLVFTPSRRLEGNVQIRVSRALRDAAGNALRARYTATLRSR